MGSDNGSQDPESQTRSVVWRPPDRDDRGLKPPPPPEGAPRGLVMNRAAPVPLLSSEAHLGVAVSPVNGSDRKHRLVAIGDSLTQGFQSFAIHRTDISWPAMIASALGFSFTYPTFDGPPGAAGLPFNLEEIIRRIDETVGSRTLAFDEVAAAAAALAAFERIREYWNGQTAANLAPHTGYYSNLAIWGWDLRDALSKSWGWSNDQIEEHVSLIKHISESALGVFHGVSHANERTAIRTLFNSALREASQQRVTQVSAIEALGKEGIDTLLVALGANNALGSVISMKVAWSQDDGFDDLELKKQYTVWAPGHFRHELDQLAIAVEKANAAHTIWLTVPHVTVVPLLRGVGEKPAYSRYFARYTRPWISDREFDPNTNPCLTGEQARAIDAAIDDYNWAIKEKVHLARAQNKDWLVVDLCGLLDRIAYRRYLASPLSRPGWWEPMEKSHPVLPPELQALPLVPDTRYFTSDKFGRTAGGLIALDGVHPTTIGYGLIAREVLDVMINVAGVQPTNPAPSSTPSIDFTALIAEDSLISHPPTHMNEVGQAVAYLAERLDLAEAYLGAAPS